MLSRENFKENPISYLFFFLFFFLSFFFLVSCFSLSYFLYFFLNFFIIIFWNFPSLYASSHLYMRVYPSVVPSVGPSVGPLASNFKRNRRKRRFQPDAFYCPPGLVFTGTVIKTKGSWSIMQRTKRNNDSGKERLSKEGSFFRSVWENIHTRQTDV